MEKQEPAWYRQVSYADAKAIIRENIASASRSFIAVGYYLKYVRDNHLYQQDGRETIWEFAQAEYGISKSTASRYMTMNDRFSKDGNSPVVAEPYREFGKSQLQEMLYLNDEQLEQVTPETRIQDIREIRGREEEIQLPGQMTVYDFPEIVPESMEPERREYAASSTVMALKDFMNLPDVAASQQEPERGTAAIDLMQQQPFYAGDCLTDTAMDKPQITMGATDAVVQLSRLRTHCQDMAKEAGSDEWSKDVAALDVAIKALRKEET